jgi:hypothetical protein
MSQGEKPTKAFTWSLLAGILIVCNAVAVGAAGAWFPWIFPTLPGSASNAEVPFASIAVIGLVCGALVLFGAEMLRIRPVNKRVWGAIVIVFSIPSVITGGGFIIGFILGVIGGVKAFKSKTLNANIKVSIRH